MTQCPYSYFEYEAQPGDTFKSLAERFGVSEQILRERNSMSEPEPGVRLKIPCQLGGLWSRRILRCAAGRAAVAHRTAQRNDAGGFAGGQSLS